MGSEQNDAFVGPRSEGTGLSLCLAALIGIGTGVIVTAAIVPVFLAIGISTSRIEAVWILSALVVILTFVPKGRSLVVPATWAARCSVLGLLLVDCLHPDKKMLVGSLLIGVLAGLCGALSAWLHRCNAVGCLMTAEDELVVRSRFGMRRTGEGVTERGSKGGPIGESVPRLPA